MKALPCSEAGKAYSATGCKIAYQFGAMGSNGCQGESISMATEQRCQAVVAYLGLTWKRSEYARGRPQGCYEATSGDGAGVYFNRHGTGGVKGTARPICQVCAAMKDESTCVGRCL